ncbi:hypothetical protein Ciccas_011355 [Cichlidogyrus casuarinus]|uniref:Galactosyltransferase C-terminal domain-containing protein n=1 Tax=Cichlidogyrus casuarinus TaxID=1844966 RepID=A0ABD2PW88_9PLAT
MSNAFEGWGGEDDDFHARTGLTGIGSTTVDRRIGSFLSITHISDRNFDPNRFQNIELTNIKKNLIGNGLYQVHYQLSSSKFHKLFTVHSFTLY